MGNSTSQDYLCSNTMCSSFSPRKRTNAIKTVKSKIDLNPIIFLKTERMRSVGGIKSFPGQPPEHLEINV